jgi:hypothetical protein
VGFRIDDRFKVEEATARVVAVQRL